MMSAPRRATMVPKSWVWTVAMADPLADVVDVEGLLGDQDDVGATGHAGVGGDPAGVAAHDLADHDPVVGLGRGVEPVDGVGGDLDGGVEPEGEVGGRQVVV